jgi:hypothetical protein
MKKFLGLILIVLISSGCSMLPRLNFGTPGTAPQATERSKAKEICKGKVEFFEDGSVKYCSKGYFNYSENYSKKERKFTIQERVANFIRNLAGMGFWALILIIILVPGSLGWLIGRLLNATNKAFLQTITAIKKFRQTSSAKEELDDFLRAEQDKETKSLIAKERTK